MLSAKCHARDCRQISQPAVALLARLGRAPHRPTACAKRCSTCWRHEIEDSVWLDLYAGTGAVGIEALSRGARTVYFVESSRKAAAIIRQNLRSLQIEEGYEVLEREAEPALRVLDSQAVSCDVCFLDPPYRMQQAYAEVLGFLSQSRLLKPSSIVVAEHDKHFDPGAKFGALERYRELKQGDAVLSFYKITLNPR